MARMAIGACSGDRRGDDFGYPDAWITARGQTARGV